MEELVEVYQNAMTPNTRLLLLTNPVNRNGQFYPVKQICEIAHRKGIEVVVDGAQAFAHIDFKQADLGCDFFGASLHKWLGAPLGTGMLFVRKDKIGKLRQLVPASFPIDKAYNEKIFKFEDSAI
jgi:selenocysteine lyase/cysteine desulfurase